MNEILCLQGTNANVIDRDCLMRDSLTESGGRVIRRVEETFGNDENMCNLIILPARGIFAQHLNEF
jgi:hypothetical protein